MSFRKPADDESSLGHHLVFGVPPPIAIGRKEGGTRHLFVCYARLEVVIWVVVDLVFCGCTHQQKIILSSPVDAILDVLVRHYINCWTGLNHNIRVEDDLGWI